MKHPYYIISALGFLALLTASGLCTTDAPLLDYLPQMVIGTAMCAGGICAAYRREKRDRAQSYTDRRRALRIAENRQYTARRLEVMGNEDISGL